jgi:hypothetical protein
LYFLRDCCIIYTLICQGGDVQRKNLNVIISFISALLLSSLACGIGQPTPTRTPTPTVTKTIVPTQTPRPSPTPQPTPTQTPNLAATQRAEELDAEVQAYFEKGYLTATNGRFIELEEFSYDWARLDSYRLFPLGESASDFFMSGHVEWDSAFRNSGKAGCGFYFSYQENKDHYAVILDRSRVYFLITDQSRGYSSLITPTRGTGLVDFDYPVEADFTLIVKGNYAYVLVDGEVVGEYTLARSRPMHGDLGLTALSSTNRGYGTHCEMTNLHLWIPIQE